VKDNYEPLQLNIFMLSATDTILNSSEHDNGNVDIGDLPTRHPDD